MRAHAIVQVTSTVGRSVIFWVGALLALTSQTLANPHELTCGVGAATNSTSLYLCDLSGNDFCPTTPDDQGGSSDKQDDITITGVTAGSQVSMTFTNRSDLGDGGAALAVGIKGQGNGDPSPTSISLPAPLDSDNTDYTVLAGDGSSVKFQVKFDPPGNPDPNKIIYYEVSCTGGVEIGDLQLIKTANVTAFSYAGQVITYEFDVINNSGVTVNQVKIVDDQLGEFNCGGGNLSSTPPGNHRHCTRDYTVTAADVTAGDPIVNVAYATANDSGNTIQSNTDSVSIPYEVLNQSVQITKVADRVTYSIAGTIINYTITVLNNGNVPISAVDVTDTATGAVAASLPVDCSGFPDPLVPGGSAICTASYTTSADDVSGQHDIDNVASVSGTVPGGGTVEDTSDIVTVAFAAQGMGDVQLSKTANPTFFSAEGDEITYTYTVLNTGDLEITDIVVTETNFTGDGGAPTITCPAGPLSLVPGASLQCSATYVITANDITAGVAISNTGHVEGTTTGGNVEDDDTISIEYHQVVPNAEIHLVKFALQGYFSETVTTLDYVYTVQNEGNVTVFNLAVADDLVSPVACDRQTLAPGEIATCTGTYQIQADDLATGQVTNTAVASADYNDSRFDSNEASVTVYYVGTAIEDAVDEATSSYILHRMDRIISQQPDRARLIRKRIDRGFGGGRAPVDLAMQFGENGRRSVSIGTSLNGIKAHAESQNQKALNGKASIDHGGFGESEHESKFDIWFESHFSAYEDSNDRDGDFGIAYVGMDYLLTPNLLVGVLAQFDWGSEEIGQKSDVAGNGWMVGPYVSSEILNNVFFDARVAWGRSDNDTTVWLSGIPYSGEFDTERWLAHAKLTGTYSRENWRVTPEASVTYMHETREDFSVLGLGGVMPTDIASRSFAIGRFQIGPEIAYRFETENGSMEPHLALRLNWDFAVEGNISLSGMNVYDPGPRGEIEAGILYRTNGGRTLRLVGNYDGIGADDFNAWSVQGWLSFPIQVD